MPIARIAVVVAATGLLAACSVTVSGTAAPASGGAAGSPAPRASNGAAPTSAGQASAGQTPTGGAYADAQGRFTIVLPDSWKVSPKGVRGAVVVFQSPRVDRSSAGPFVPNINVVITPGVANLDATVVAARGVLRTFTNYQSTTDEAVSLSDGTPAHLFGGTFTQLGFQVQNLQLLAVSGASSTVVTGTSLQQSWAANGPPLKASLLTLTVGP